MLNRRTLRAEQGQTVPSFRLVAASRLKLHTTFVMDETRPSKEMDWLTDAYSDPGSGSEERGGRE